jgi:hypothetical protein
LIQHLSEEPQSKVVNDLTNTKIENAYKDALNYFKSQNRLVENKDATTTILDEKGNKSELFIILNELETSSAWSNVNILEV